MTIHQMNILDHSGHSVTKWDPDDEDEVAQARAMFNAMRAAGHQAFAVEGEKNQGRRMTEFDPEAARIMFVPQLRGG